MTRNMDRKSQFECHSHGDFCSTFDINIISHSISRPDLVKWLEYNQLSSDLLMQEINGGVENLTGLPSDGVTVVPSQLLNEASMQNIDTRSGSY